MYKLTMKTAAYEMLVNYLTSLFYISNKNIYLLRAND